MVFTPKSTVLNSLSDLENIGNTLIYIVFFIGLILSVFVSQCFYYPISNLINDIQRLPINLPKRIAEKGEMDYIKSNLAKIVSKKISLEKSLNTSKPLIAEFVLCKLLLGDKEIENAISICRQLNLEFTEGFYCIAVFRNYCASFNETEGTYDIAKFCSLVREHLSMYTPNTIKISGYEQVIIMHLKDVQNEHVIVADLNKFSVSYKRLFENHAFNIGLGEIVKEIYNINYSYKQAIDAIKYRNVKDEGKIIKYSDIANSISFAKRADIPYDMEKKLLNYITSGNEELAIEYINKVLDNNYKENIRYYFYYMLCESLQDIINRIINDWTFNKANDIELGIQHMHSIEEDSNALLLKAKTISNIRCIVRYFKKLREDHPYLTKIIDFVDNNFADDINLESVADKFNYSISYLSKCFKQCMGISFTNYLNTKKLSYAKELLSDTGKSISHIAKESGFSSANVFIRFFKNQEGLTPGEFRKQSITEKKA